MKVTSATLLASLCLCACTSNPGSPQVTGQQPTRVDTIVQLLPACPSDTPEWNQGVQPEGIGVLLPIVGTIAVKLIEKGIDAGVKYLKQRQLDLNATTFGRDTEEFYSRAGDQLKTRFACVVFARGEVGSKLLEGAEDEFFTRSRLELLRRDADQRVNERINLVKAPIVYAEFSINYDKEPSQNFFLRANLLDYRDTAAKRRGKQKSLAFSFDFALPGSADSPESEQLFAKFQIPLKEVSYGTRWTRGDLVTLVSAPQALPPGSPELGKPNLALLTVLGTLAEVEDPSQLEILITGTAESSQDKVTEGLTNAFKNWFESLTKQNEDSESEEEAE